jgi:hypothetical protein
MGVSVLNGQTPKTQRAKVFQAMYSCGETAPNALLLILRPADAVTSSGHQTERCRDQQAFAIIPGLVMWQGPVCAIGYMVIDQENVLKISHFLIKCAACRQSFPLSTVIDPNAAINMGSGLQVDRLGLSVDFD